MLQYNLGFKTLSGSLHNKLFLRLIFDFLRDCFVLVFYIVCRAWERSKQIRGTRASWARNPHPPKIGQNHHPNGSP